ncbi:S-layer homology domain-containing protein [Gorillibacterium timonense]|uniref:S-layer homology domain-containing protein n=1 Tax=Gorillibacterium timonense TaxID=1689269 RepID=UPI000B01363E|nr:S-layer homology domain-containing protein [Gorillibacterium timonense]
MKKWICASLILSLVASVFSVNHVDSAYASPPQDGGTNAAVAMTSAQLADSTATQQRWLSVPDSRIVLNPGNHPDSGAHFPLGSGYYVQGKAKGQDRLLETFQASGMVPPKGGEQRPVKFDEPFDNLSTNDWKTSGVTASAVDGRAVVTTTGDWGSITSKEITLNLTESPYLVVTVPKATGKWALKIDKGYQRMVQSDTTDTGSFLFDLRTLSETKELTGDQTFKVMLFVSGGSGNTAEFDSLQFQGAPATGGSANPDEGKEIGFLDEFDSFTYKLWKTAESAGNDTVMTFEDGLSKMTIGSNAGYGAIERQVTVNLSETPSLSIKVPETTGKWAIKLNTGGSYEPYVLQNDTSATGVFTYDLAGITGWSGVKTFKIKIFQVGAQGSWTKLDRLTIHADDRWLNTASTSQTTWRPEAIDYSGTYAAGTVTGSDLFYDTESATRTIHSDLSSGAVAVAGEYTGSAAFAADRSVLTVVDKDRDYTFAIALPEGTTPLYFSSANDVRLGRNAMETPSSGSGYWVATLPGKGDYAVGVGYAVGGDANAANTAVERARAAATLEGAATSRAHYAEYWDNFLAKVPVVEDFNILHVNQVGVTPEDVKQMYYMAWIGLSQNILPPTPERGGSHRQIATGKPSMYTSGPRGAEASASWDSLFGMQFMAYVEPDIAWETFEGMMAGVESDGKLGGESLPARKAQTAWILYEVTGDKERLAGIYDNLVKHLRWAAKNLRWSFGDGGPNERDGEFVISLIIDYGYARQISELLGKTADAAEWVDSALKLKEDYKNWFFPKKGTTLYKHWLDGSRPDDTGLTMYVTTGLHVPELPEYYVNELVDRFHSEYNPAMQLAGLGNESLKAPDAQFMTYGLLDQGKVEEATVLIHSFTRDIVRTKTFAEVYQKSSEDITAIPIATSIYPSIFGNIHLIDNLWIANGYRMDLGAPAFVRLPESTGGIKGLTWMGKGFDADIDGSTIRMTGEATELPGAYSKITAQTGVTVQWGTNYEEPAVPAAPANLSTLAGDGKVTLRWDAVPNADSYQVYRFEGGAAPTDPSAWQLVEANIKATTFTAAGLTNGTHYAFAVKAVNLVGESDFSPAEIATPTGEVLAVPSTPVNLTASAGGGEGTLSWDSSADAVSYAVYQYEGTAAPADPADWRLLTSSVTAATYTVSGLTNGTSYAFAVKAANAIGESDFSNVTITVPVAKAPELPAAPQNLTGTAGDGTAALNWSAATGADHYSVYRYKGGAPADPGSWELVQAGVTVTGYTVTGLTNGTSYAFAVKAVNAAGESVLSNMAVVAPAAPVTPDNGGNTGGTGTGSSESSTVTSTNGSIVIPNGKSGEVSLNGDVSVSLPAGTADGELRVIIEKLAAAAVPQADQGAFVSSAYEMTKNVPGLFRKPVTITMKFDPAKVGADQRVAIFYYDEAKKTWVEVGGVVTGDWIAAVVNHFTKFAVLAVDEKTTEAEPEQPAVTFTDIAGHWGENAIRNAASKKLITGYPDGTFKPNGAITRAEFTVMLAKAFGLKGTGSTLSFTDDAKIGAWAKEAVAQAVEARIVSGYTDDSFRPNEHITRAEMAAMIARALKLPLDAESATSFADDAVIPKWAKAAVEAMYQLGIVNGRSSDKFVPNDTATRAEAVTMLLRAMEPSNL